MATALAPSASGTTRRRWKRPLPVPSRTGLPTWGSNISTALWVPLLHPEMRVAPHNTEWNFTGDITRMPEVTAPALGNKPNLVTIEAQIPANANGVLYKLGGHSGGLTLFVEDGILCYEYNLFIIMRTKIRATQKLPVGKAKIEVETVYAEPKPAGPLKVAIKVNGNLFASGVVPVSAPLLFTANDCLDIGIALRRVCFAGLPRKGAIQIQRHDR